MPLPQSNRMQSIIVFQLPWQFSLLLPHFYAGQILLRDKSVIESDTLFLMLLDRQVICFDKNVYLKMQSTPDADFGNGVLKLQFSNNTKHDAIDLFAPTF